MIDLGFAVLLAILSSGIGKRLLDEFGESPEHPGDALALAMPLGLGTVALATLGLGELGCLNKAGMAMMLTALAGLGIFSLSGLCRELWDSRPARRCGGRGFLPGTAMAVCAVIALLGTAVAALAPVTDGDALCYHLQVPKIFLGSQAVGFDPDLHETTYPLVTELLYCVALVFRGPIACRGIQWTLGLTLAANVAALARPCIGGRAWWAGAVVLLVPAVSNGMSAPLNDVALAAFGTASLFAWTRLQERRTYFAAIVGGLCAGLAIGVKYPGLVSTAILIVATALKALVGQRPRSLFGRLRWLQLAAVYLAAALAAGGWWYLRAYVHTGNPVYPFFRSVFAGAGLDEVLDPIKRPLAITPLNLLFALAPLSLEPGRFDSFSHQLGPVFLLFLPAAILERAPRRVIGLLAFALAFLMICMTQRQSTRFLLIATGPMAVAIAFLACRWCDRRTVAGRLLFGLLIALLGAEACWAVTRSRHALAVVTGRESVSDFLARREPTFIVGRWVAGNLPAGARLIGQDHRGFYIPRPYTMELAHRRRTGLGSRSESPSEIVAALLESGFTHLLLCPPIPETAVEFDPALGRLLAPWLAMRTPIFSRELSDGDGVVRRYAIYELSRHALFVGESARDRLTGRLRLESAQ
jgi:hypothetical protein